MKLKTSLFIIATLITSIISAQNLTLAKAFYKRAQQEYSNKNYAQVFNLLDKTKEQLGGESNPEITYLEAKAHYSNDINAVIAKRLLTQFLEEADPNDSRVDEVSSLIVDIEISDKIDEHGNFKSLVGRSGIKTSYYDTGKKEWVQEFKNGVKNGFIKRYNKKGVLIQSGSQKNGYVNGFYEWFYDTGGLKQTNYYNESGKKTKEQRNYNVWGKLQYIYTYSNGKKNGLYKYFYEGKLSTKGSYENDKFKGKFTYYFNNGKVSSIYTYNNSPSYDTKTPSFIEGIKTSYYDNGEKKQVENYVKGKLKGVQKYYHDNGKLKRWEHINSNGRLYGQRAYYYKSNGKRAINIAYENGRAMKLLEQFDINGKKLKISKLKKGNGYIKRVNEKGDALFEANFVDGYKNGLVKTYWETGGIYSKANYNKGYKEGLTTNYRKKADGGKIWSTTIYKKSKKGVSKSYYKDGSLDYIYDYGLNKTTLNNNTVIQTKTLNTLLDNNKSIDEIIAFCRTKNIVGRDFYLSETVINSFGYKLMSNNKSEDALKIFRINIEFYPEAWNTYDSYGECLLKLNKFDEAKQSYKKSLELNPENKKVLNLLEGDNFLKENKTKEGVQTTESGLQYIILKEGQGAKPTTANKVKVNYHGTLLDGTVFDSSVERGKADIFGVSEVIKGWTETLQLMTVGSKYKVFIPQELAYGGQRRGGIIKPFSVLIFEIELLEILDQ